MATRIGKVANKFEPEIITISINLRLGSYDNDEGFFLLDLDFCLEYLTDFRVLS